MTRFLGALVLCLAAATFALENDQPVRLVFLGLTAPAIHLAFIVLAALVLGAAVAVLLGSVQVLRLRGRASSLERELEATRARLAEALDRRAVGGAPDNVEPSPPRAPVGEPPPPERPA
jgi:putative membrane protein